MQLSVAVTESPSLLSPSSYFGSQAQLLHAAGVVNLPIWLPSPGRAFAVWLLPSLIFFFLIPHCVFMMVYPWHWETNHPAAPLPLQTE